ncbi:MAG TPA: hypothetical protein VLF60_03180 [Candidatus Saccharimonadales bacterium]|nr:hypothetical protein [Candidatus Saccharimonadales bacterium]
MTPTKIKVGAYMVLVAMSMVAVYALHDIKGDHATALQPTTSQVVVDNLGQ